MKKKLSVFSILIIIIMFSSCKKGNTGDQPTNNLNTHQIKSIIVTDTLGHVLTVSTCFYDNRKRLLQITKLVNSPVPDTLFYKFEYSQLKVIVKRNIFHDSLISEKTIYELNSVGLTIASTVILFSDASDSMVERSDTYEYDSDGYLSKQILTLYGSPYPATAVYQVANRNYESETLSSTSSSSIWKENYSYDTGHISSIGNPNVGLSFLGKSSYNPMIRATIDSTGAENATYSYQYDQNNRISQVIVNGDITPGVNGLWYSLPVLKTHQIVSYTYY